MSSDVPPLGEPGFDLYADQRGRIIGSLTSMIILTTLFTFLRLLSRRLARAGFWVRKPLHILHCQKGNLCGLYH